MRPEDGSYKKIPKKAAQVINVCAKLNLEVSEEKEEMDMCQAWEEQKEEGRQEGRQEGIDVLIKTLLDLNLSKEEIIERTASNFLISREQAEEYYCTIESLKN